ncbi:MAG: hypothetical protein V8S24_14730 [Gordonibacter pamelaeae]
MADGILGALVRHAEDAAMSERADLNQVFATVFDTFTKPALDRLRASLPGDGSMSPSCVILLRHPMEVQRLGVYGAFDL